MSLKSVLGWAAVAFVVWFVIENPHAAQDIVRNIGTFFTSATHGLSNFFSTI